MSSYMYFCTDFRTQNSQINDIIEAGQLQGQEWRNLSDARKSKFDKLAATDRDRYTLELAQYKQTHGCAPPPKRVKKEAKPAKDPEKPRGAMSSYMYFCTDFRAKNKSNALSVVEAGELQGAEWRSMSDAKRAKYDQLALRDRERHNAEMATYRVTHPEQAQQPGKKVGPKKPTSSYMFFSQEVRSLARPPASPRLTSILCELCVLCARR
jgi:hypothetical protein